MKLQIHNAPIVYLSFSLFLLFTGINRIPRSDVIYEIFFILLITFVLNALCINGLNKVAWYFVIFFILVPIILAIMAMMPLIVSIILDKLHTFKKSRMNANFEISWFTIIGLTFILIYLVTILLLYLL